MSFLGMLAMGIFVGLVATQGTQYIHTRDDWKMVLAAILGACFGGVAVSFINRQIRTAGNAIYLYPVGLLLGYSWFQTPSLAAMLLKNDTQERLVAGAGMAGNIGITVIALLLVLPPAAREAGILPCKPHAGQSPGVSAVDH